jgi:hypothetical protein
MDTDFGSSSLWKSALQRTRSDGQAFQSVDKLFRGLLPQFHRQAMIDEPALQSLREALEQVRDRLDSIIARLRSREEIRCLRWRCDACGHMKNFTLGTWASAFYVPSDARPCRPALPEVQRSKLRGRTVTQASSLFGRAAFQPAMSKALRKAGRNVAAGEAGLSKAGTEKASLQN